MAKATSILDTLKEIKKGKLLPLYYLFGEDAYNLSFTLKSIAEKVQPLLSSDFDKETFYGDNITINQVLDLASTFPFGSEKKLIIVKEAEKIKDKKPLKDYALSPTEFTILVFIHNGTITNLKSEPFKTLLAHNFLFEAKELKGRHLINWLINYCESKGKSISEENAQVLVDMVGENRNLLEMQIEKLITHEGNKKGITIEAIQQVSSSLKQNTIFDLQNAIGLKDKPNALKIAYNLLENGTEPVFMVAMLTRYFIAISKISELRSKKIPDATAARTIGVHHFFYPGYVKARSLFSDKKLIEVFRALLKSDVSIKTTSTGGKEIITILIAEILQ
ncbi:MAG: DNA polymerase III subunit delta [Ignavibacteria bacterium]|nr:DNA polymerase III subunit delta [Ignavibacteria bacterium]MBT8383253.1 DNA polymerase III subunit delta [Ignavibacteria bacterium]MBT8390358.1 DNA polymerase III subunit delta [Ignavibacteria bacterium]NNJ53382.1 DNA polymerase III subunit delta [Ignavibacteriaceae bacterium]